MKTTIFYFSATGNSLKVSRDIALELGDTNLIPIAKAIGKPIDMSARRIGLVFPVYAWGLPVIVAEFIKKISVTGEKYVFAVATCAGSIGATLKQTKKILRSRGITLNAGFKLVMPGNYIPLYGAIAHEKQKSMFKEEQTTVNMIAAIIKKGTNYPIDTGFFLTNFFLSGIIYKLFVKNVKSSYKYFWVTPDCDGCGICQKVCPVKNIVIIDGHPAWLNKCEQCMACLQWCPREAIQFGKKSRSRKRYHHPDIKVTDLF